MNTQQHQELPLEQYRNYLLVLARSNWDSALQGCGEPSDLVQQTLLEAYSQREKYRGSSIPELMSWLRKILANNMADGVRANTRAKRDYRRVQSYQAALDNSSMRLGMFLASRDPSPSEQAMQAEELAILADLLCQLPNDQHEVVILHFIEDLTYKQIAERMNISETVIPSLFRCGFMTLVAQMKKRKG